MRKISKAGISFAAAGLLVAGVAGVGVTQANASSTHLTAAKSSIPAPAAAVPELLGGTTGVSLDSNFLAALKSLGLTPSVYGTAKLSGSDITFPITGGSVVYWNKSDGYRPYVQGILEHDGSGLTLTAGSTAVTLADFTINPGNSMLYGDVSVNGKVAAVQAPLFNLYGGSLKPLKLDGDNAILTGTTVHISATAAKLLDTTFKTTAVKSQLLVGVATITAKIK